MKRKTSSMSAQHTPGPWETSVLCSDDTRSIEIVLPEREYEVIAVVCGIDEEAQATAALIASAPALHAYIVRRLNERFAQIAAAGHAYDSTADNDTEAIELRALLALARGEA